MSDAYDVPGELLSVALLPTGVIIGMRDEITIDQADTIRTDVERYFPGIRCAVIGGCITIATFTYDEVQP